MLALICSSLDFGPTTPHEGRYAQHCGTLIVATKSSEYSGDEHTNIYGLLTLRKALYGWVDQASQ